MFSKLILPSLSLELASFLSIKCSRDGPSREVFVLHVGLAFDRVVFSEYNFVRIQGFSVADLTVSGAAISSSIPVVAQLPGPLAAEVAELLPTDTGDVVTAISQLDPLPAVWAALVVFSSYEPLKRRIKVLLRNSMVLCERLAAVGNTNLWSIVAYWRKACRTSQAGVQPTSRTQLTHRFCARTPTEESAACIFASEMATVDPLRHWTSFLTISFIEST